MSSNPFNFVLIFMVAQAALCRAYFETVGSGGLIQRLKSLRMTVVVSGEVSLFQIPSVVAEAVKVTVLANLAGCDSRGLGVGSDLSLVICKGESLNT